MSNICSIAPRWNSADIGEQCGSLTSVSTYVPYICGYAVLPSTYHLITFSSLHSGIPLSQYKTLTCTSAPHPSENAIQVRIQMYGTSK